MVQTTVTWLSPDIICFKLSEHSVILRAKDAFLEW